MHCYHLQHPLNEGNLEIMYYIIQGRLHIETYKGMEFILFYSQV